VDLHLLEPPGIKVQILFLTHTLPQVVVVVRERQHCPLQVAQAVVVVVSQEPLDQARQEILQAHHLLKEMQVETEMIMVQVLLLLVEEAVVPGAQETTHQVPQPRETVVWVLPTQSQDQVLPVQLAEVAVLINSTAQERLEQAVQALAAMEVATD
jgi:hypothetical protein